MFNLFRNNPVNSPAQRCARIAASIALVALGTSTASAQPTPQATAPKGVIYVESNDPAKNAIFAFKQNADGSLTQMPGSPFATGGLGVGPSTALGPYDSDQEIITNSDHSLLFAVNGGSDTISIFQIKSDGSLTPVEGSPFPSGGSNPVSLGLSRDSILCVVNQDQNPGHPGRGTPNYTSFRVTEAGSLVPVKRSTYSVDDGSSPSQALISPDGSLMFGADFLGGLLRTFRIAGNGRLVPSDVQPLPAAEFADSGAPALPLGMTVHPKRRLLYVNFVTINRTAVYQYDRAGNLDFLRTVPDSGKAACWDLINKAATRLYASNTADSSISVYDIEQDPTEPIEIQKFSLKSVGGAYQFALDPTEQYLYVVTQKDVASKPDSANAISVLQVGPDGKLTEVPSSPMTLPVPSLVRPQGVLAF